MKEKPSNRRTMIIAKYQFEPYQNELPEFNLKLLVNIEDLNNAIYDEVFAVLTPQQQEQYLVYKTTDEAKEYRKERDAELPYVDFSSLPKFLDEELLEKLLVYFKDLAVRTAIIDWLSIIHSAQIWELYVQRKKEEQARKYALMSFEEQKEEMNRIRREEYLAKSEPRFQGNMGEPDTVTSYILQYGFNPITREPETSESFHKKYTIDPKTGKPIPREQNE